MNKMIVLEKPPNPGRCVPYRQPTRAELLIHVALGAAAMVTVVFAVCDSFRFATDLECIAQRLSTPQAAVAHCTSSDRKQSSLTNIGTLELQLPWPTQVQQSNVPSRTL